MREKILQTIRPLGDVSDAGADGLPAPVGDHDLNAAPRADAPLTPAAVLVPLVVRPDGLQVLLTQRTDHLHDHAGQVSFPGGRREHSDADSVQTALRETREEIGLVEDFIEVVGLLDDYETGTGFRVTPVVSFVSEGFTWLSTASRSRKRSKFPWTISSIPPITRPAAATSTAAGAPTTCSSTGIA